MVLYCDVCHATCSYQVCFGLKPCNHLTCLKCFHQAAPASHALQCPVVDCQKWIESSTLFEISDSVGSHWDKTPSSKAENAHEFLNLSRPVQEVIHFEPDEQMDPFRHWAMKKPDLYSGFVYVAFRCNNEDASFYKANFKAANSTVFIDDDSSDDLIKIFARVLHPLLFRKDFINHNDGRLSGTETQGSCLDKSLTIPRDHERQQLALKSLFALSSGRIMSPEEHDEISNEGLYSCKTIKQKAIECAKDLAKELLMSTTTCQNGAKASNASMPKKKSKKTSVILSPIIENQPHRSIEYPGTDCEFDCCDLLPRSLEKAETQVAFMLGFLLVGAAWVMSN
ncbi:hypothetical protein IV203_012241 [Nitzschia inconspicua]|uniref:RING-type domain-containing protein n=1 Tax=Nitzschia inconspicua TaxID=303405 RepID=A0A9K3KUM6_9STRA|nr:hypothetical protein IV203_012241 [Nitzschia inconspicua]